MDQTFWEHSKNLRSHKKRNTVKNDHMHYKICKFGKLIVAWQITREIVNYFIGICVHIMYKLNGLKEKFTLGKKEKLQYVFELYIIHKAKL